jgi:hypothetical protein
VLDSGLLLALAGKINTTDLDSRNVKTPRSYTQDYNVQAVVTEATHRGRSRSPPPNAMSARSR